MTETEARALLRNATVPAGLPQAERDWIAGQFWRETGRGWLVDGLREGVRYHVDRVPTQAGALYVASGHPADRKMRPGVWIEARGF